MEKITAFKAFNGKVFETEEKCIEYENKMKLYPKTTHEQTRIHNTLNIVKHTITTKQTPTSPKLINSYYVVNNKYKLSYFGDCVIPFTEKGIDETPKSANLARIDHFVIKAIIKYNDFNNEIANEAIIALKEVMNWSRFEIKEHKKDYWILEDNRWHNGIASPLDCFLKIEKIT